MKERIILNLIYFFSSFILVLLFHILILNRKRKTYTDGKKQTEINYLVKKFKLDLRTTKYKTVLNYVTFINTLVISITFVLVNNIKNFLLSLFIGFIVMLLLIYSLYEIVGRYLKRKEVKKHV